MKARSFLFVALACLPAFAEAEESLTVPAIETTASAGTVASGSSASLPPPVSLLSGTEIPLTHKQKRGLHYANQWAGNTEMPARGDDGSVVFTFGSTLPSVVCAPLYVCDIALQPGETVNDMDIGDSVRWKVTPASSGSGPDAVTHVIIKPTDTGLSTNLLITTSRRTYSIKLVSRSHDWMPSVSFAYPEDSRAEWAAFQQDRQHAHNASTLVTGESVATLDFQYRLSGDDPGWKPVRVYSSSAKTWIEFPASVAHGDLPTLVALNNDGGLFSSPTPRMINYRLVGDRFEVDGVLDHAALITGVGGNQQRVEITHAGASSHAP